MSEELITMTKEEYQSLITSTLSIGGFVPVNKVLAKNMGIYAALMVGELLNEQEYFEKHEMLTEDGFFFSTIENVEEATALTRRQQATALDTLKDLGIVEVDKRGLPAKRYIKIDRVKIGTYLNVHIGTTSLYKNAKLVCTKTPLNNNNIIKITNNKESNTLTSITKESRHNEIDFDSVIDSMVTNEKLKETIKAFIETRKSIKHPFRTENGFRMTIKKALSYVNGDEEKAIGIFETSIANEYQGVFPPKNSNTRYNGSTPDQNKSLNDWFAEIDAVQ